VSRRDEDAGALTAYLRGIGKLPRLTFVEERELGRRIQLDGDQAALTRLVEANLLFVVSYAKRYRGLGVSFLDLIHEGNLGLLEAARRFDPSRNVKFITFAVWWVREAMTWYERAEAIRPAGNDDALLRWNACVRLLARKPGLAPASEDRGDPLLLE